MFSSESLAQKTARFSAESAADTDSETTSVNQLRHTASSVTSLVITAVSRAQCLCRTRLTRGTVLCITLVTEIRYVMRRIGCTGISWQLVHWMKSTTLSLPVDLVPSQSASNKFSFQRATCLTPDVDGHVVPRRCPSAPHTQQALRQSRSGDGESERPTAEDATRHASTPSAARVRGCTLVCR